MRLASSSSGVGNRERENLVQEKLRIENRIEALLFTQGIRKRPSLRSWERERDRFRLWSHQASAFQVGRVSPGLRLMHEAFWCGLFDRPDRM